MRIRQTTCIFATLTLLVISLTSCRTTQQSSTAKQKLPNIIFILADDLGYGDTGPYGQTMISTPNIDLLAKQGMLFTQCYAGSTVCAPSRSSLMTGLHTGHTRVRGNAQVPLRPTDITIAELLKRSGYKTGMIGKWGLGEDSTTGAPWRKGFDYFYGYINQTRAHNYYPDHIWENDQRIELDNKVSFVPNGLSGIATEKKTYTPDKFLDKTIQFLEKNKDSSFFLYLPYTLPHANNEAKQFNQSGMEVPDLGQYKDKDWPYDQRAHAAMISLLDTQVGLIMKKLKELGLDENTLVIFASDNGPHNEGGADANFFNSNGPLRGAKRDMYEGGIRVPFIAHWPNRIKPGTKTDNVIAFWDIMPAFCELAGIKNMPAHDGISFIPTLIDQPQQKHDYLYWEFYEQGGKQAVRFDNWKCIWLNLNEPGKTEVQLFDLSKDMGEQNNVASQHPDIISKASTIKNQAHVYSPDFHFTQELIIDKKR
jgi:arylsulfatase A-like enzyme